MILSVKRYRDVENLVISKLHVTEPSYLEFIHANINKLVQLI